MLLRALEPTDGLEAMRERRGFDEPRRLCSGPAKLTQALAITRADDGLRACDARRRRTADARRDVGAATRQGRLFCARGAPRAARRRRGRARAPRIVATPRIGVAAAPDTPWRFVDADSPFLSRPLPRARRR